MAAISKKDYSLDELEIKYNQITELFTYADQLIDTVESPLAGDIDYQMSVVEPLVGDLGEATDILAEEFILIAEARRGRNAKSANKNRIEAALRRVYNALSDYQARVADVSKKAHGALQNIADPIVKKIQRHVEEIVLIFLEFIGISLASIMHKQQLEAVKLRDTRFTQYLHQQTLSQQ